MTPRADQIPSSFQNGTLGIWRRSLLVALVICLMPTAAFAVEFVAGQVVEIVDVNLLRVQTTVGTDETLRIIGIDAAWRGTVPTEESEFRRIVFKRQKKFLANRILRFRLDSTLDDIRHQDEQGRVLVHAYLANGLDFAELLIRKGYARPDFSIPFDPQTMKRYKDAEMSARENMRGLWANQWPPETRLRDTTKLKRRAWSTDQQADYVLMNFTCKLIEVLLRAAIIAAQHR
jgi:endonuclease YncB( thermonuclease family)